MRLALMVVIVAVLGMSCKKDKKRNAEAVFDVSMSNETTSLALSSNSVPDSLEVTVLYVNVAEDIVDNMFVGGGGFIYINPDCRRTDNEIEELEEEEKNKGAANPVIGDSDIDGCAHQGDDWESNGKTMVVSKVAETTIDLAKGNDDVNEELNSQKRKFHMGQVAEGDTAKMTIRYAGIAFRVETHQEDPNAFWTFDKTSAEGEFNWVINERLIKFEEPIELAEGDSIVINLSYDLEDSIEYGADVETTEKEVGGGTSQPGRADDCVGTMGSANYTCVTIPEFGASFSKAE